jgi:hypothetical protein
LGESIALLQLRRCGNKTFFSALKTSGAIRQELLLLLHLRQLDRAFSDFFSKVHRIGFDRRTIFMALKHQQIFSFRERNEVPFFFSLFVGAVEIPSLFVIDGLK